MRPAQINIFGPPDVAKSINSLPPQTAIRAPIELLKLVVRLADDSFDTQVVISRQLTPL